MSNVVTDPRLESIVLDEDDIRSRVEAICSQIASHYDAQTGPLHLVALLKGAYVFAADLARGLCRAGVAVRIHFIRASTYKSGIKNENETSREVRISGEIPDMKGKKVLLVDDVLDQGFTLSAVKEYFLRQGVDSVQTCVFLRKKLANPSAEVRALRERFIVDYCGAELPDRWVVGYGLDISDEFRELPYVAIAREECFR